MPLITAPQALPTLAEAKEATQASPTLKQSDTLKTALESQTPGEKTPDEASGAPAEESASLRLAKLAQKEKAIHQQRKQVQAERAEIEKLRADVESVRGWKEKLLKEPLSVLSEAGLSYDQLTQLVLNGGQSHSPEMLEMQRVQKEIDALKQAQESEKKAAEERTSQQFEQTKKQLKNEVLQAVAANPAYARVSEMESEEAAVNLIVERFNKDGTILTAEEATAAVNDYLKEEQTRLLKLTSFQELLKEIQAAQTPVAAPPTQSPTLAKKPAQPHRTLSSSMNSVAKPSRKTTWAQQKAEVLAKVLGQKS